MIIIGIRFLYLFELLMALSVVLFVVVIVVCFCAVALCNFASFCLLFLSFKVLYEDIFIFCLCHKSVSINPFAVVQCLTLIKMLVYIFTKVRISCFIRTIIQVFFNKNIILGNMCDYLEYIMTGETLILLL